MEDGNKLDFIHFGKKKWKRNKKGAWVLFIYS